MSKITDDDLTRSGTGMTGCFIAVPYGNSGRRKVNRVSQQQESPAIADNTRKVCASVARFLYKKRRGFYKLSVVNNNLHLIAATVCDALCV